MFPSRQTAASISITQKNNPKYASPGPSIRRQTDRKVLKGAAMRQLYNRRLLHVQQADHFFNTPNVVTDARLHGWGDAEGLVNAAKVIPHVVQAELRNVVRQLLAETVGQPGEARMDILIVRFCLSMKLVEMCLGAFSNCTTSEVA
jgi:hypothetical protein